MPRTKKKLEVQKGETQIKWKFNGFSIDFFSLSEPKDDILSDFQEDKLQTEFGLGVNIDAENNLFNVLFKVNYYYENKENQRISLLNTVIVSKFFIVNIIESLNVKDKTFIMNDELMYTFISLSYSSIRGIIFTKTLGNFLNKYILPAISSEQISTMIKDIQGSQNISKIAKNQ